MLGLAAGDEPRGAGGAPRRPRQLGRRGATEVRHGRGSMGGEGRGRSGGNERGEGLARQVGRRRAPNQIAGRAAMGGVYRIAD